MDDNKVIDIDAVFERVMMTHTPVKRTCCLVYCALFCLSFCILPCVRWFRTRKFLFYRIGTVKRGIQAPLFKIVWSVDLSI